MPRRHMSVSPSGLRLLVLTALAMLAFAGNSLLCRAALRDTDIDAATWVRLACVAASVFVIVEIEKWLLRRAQARRA